MRSEAEAVGLSNDQLNAEQLVFMACLAMALILLAATSSSVGSFCTLQIHRFYLSPAAVLVHFCARDAT